MTGLEGADAALILFDSPHQAFFQRAAGVEMERGPRGGLHGAGHVRAGVLGADGASQTAAPLEKATARPPRPPPRALGRCSGTPATRSRRSPRRPRPRGPRRRRRRERRPRFSASGPSQSAAQTWRRRRRGAAPPRRRAAPRRAGAHLRVAEPAVDRVVQRRGRAPHIRLEALLSQRGLRAPEGEKHPGRAGIRSRGDSRRGVNRRTRPPCTPRGAASPPRAGGTSPREPRGGRSGASGRERAGEKSDRREKTTRVVSSPRRSPRRRLARATRRPSRSR